MVESSSDDHLHVVVAVVLTAHEQVLMTQRRPDAHQGGKWEFPGGKVEAGEAVDAALARELLEEVGIFPFAPQPLIRVHHSYHDRKVLLDTWLVQSWRGSAQAREGQPMRWIDASRLGELDLPEANRPIVDELALRLRSR